MGLRKRLLSLRRTELGGLAHDSFHVGIWQAAVSIADLAQLALITHVLGLNAFGRLALAMSFVVLVGQFFDVRVGTAATTFGARRLAAGDIPGLSGLFRLSYLIDGSAGVLSFAIVAGLAPLVGPRLLHGNGSTLILLYALTMLISTGDESSITVMRLLDRFHLLAAYSVALEALRVVLIAGALAIDQSLTAVLLALVVYDLAGAGVYYVGANATFRNVFGKALLRANLSSFDERRSMLRMVFQTNVVSYARIAQVQLPTLLLGALSTTTQVAYYKVGSSAASLVGRLADPGYAAVLPRLARMVAGGRRDELRRLLVRSTVVAASVMGPALFFVVIARHPILRLLGGGEAVSASTVLILLAVGQVVNGALFWNTGLLFAAGRAAVVTWISLAAVVLQVSLLVPLAALFDAEGAAVALAVSYIATNAIATVAAIRTVRGSEPLDRSIDPTPSRLPASAD